MFTNEDYERLLVKYTTQGIPAGESIQHFCDRMKVPYNLFDKWYRDTRHKIVKVKVDGMPSAEGEDNREKSLMDSLVTEGLQSIKPSSKEIRAQSVSTAAHDTGCAESAEANKAVRIMIDLRTTSGLQVRRKGMTYTQFLDFATKLSALC